MRNAWKLKKEETRTRFAKKVRKLVRSDAPDFGESGILKAFIEGKKSDQNWILFCSSMYGLTISVVVENSVFNTWCTSCTMKSLLRISTNFQISASYPPIVITLLIER